MAARRAAASETTVAGVRLSHPDKVLYPGQGITKGDLARYYAAVAPHMLPHVARRPVTLVRCPAGRQRACFYQRHAGSGGVPPQLGQVTIRGFEESGAYLFVKDVQGLVALVQIGVLEIHPWGARVDRPDRPDRIVFDLDPGEGLAFADVVAAALEVRAFLERLGLETFAKTTGGKGLHVVVPITRRHDWPQAKAFAKNVATAIAATAPERYLTRMAKDERHGRIFIDYLRNDATASAVSAYSTRARPGAPVATPLEWREVAPGLDPAAFTVTTVPARLERLGRDPWTEMAAVKQALPASMME
jgi:bifunctional non-homologous end joining protein LigD